MTVDYPAMGGECPTCGGYLPGEGPRTCRCGSLWARDDIDWEQVLHMLLVRSGGRCEARTPDCLGDQHGLVHRLPRQSINIHHRNPRKMGGTDRADIHDLANLMLLCGSGNVTGCHSWIERDRTRAYARGYLVHDEHDPAGTLVVMPSGRYCGLDSKAPFYLCTDRYAPPFTDWTSTARIPEWHSIPTYAAA